MVVVAYYTNEWDSRIKYQFWLKTVTFKMNVIGVGGEDKSSSETAING